MCQLHQLTSVIAELTELLSILDELLAPIYKRFVLLEKLIGASKQIVTLEEIETFPELFYFPTGLQILVKVVPNLLCFFYKILHVRNTFYLLCRYHLFQLTVQVIAQGYT